MAVNLIEVFPQIDIITDDALKEEVFACWLEALKRGGWEIEDLQKIPFTLLASSVTVSLADHTRNVTDTSIAIGKVLDGAYTDIFRVNFDILVAGALLHDVGKALEYAFDGESYVLSENGRLLRHPISGCALAGELGLSEPVKHIIAAHSWEGDRGHRSPEAYIVHHADFVNFHPITDR